MKQLYPPDRFSIIYLTEIALGGGQIRIPLTGLAYNLDWSKRMNSCEMIRTSIVAVWDPEVMIPSGMFMTRIC